MDLLGLIASFATSTTYRVTREARGKTVRGNVQPGVMSTLTITGSVSPMTGADLLRLPEGRRFNETRCLFTTTLLYIGDQGGDFEADSVTIDGREWECQHIETWLDPVTGNTAYRVIMQEAV